MNRLSQKFLTGITLILAFATCCSILLNNHFMEKYYLFQKRAALHTICEDFALQLQRGLSANDAIARAESADKVLISQIHNAADLDNDNINDEIRAAFQEKGIGFQKYWLWEEDYQWILSGSNRIRLYSQEQLNYGLLIEYTMIGNELFAVTMIVPNIADAFSIINTFIVLVNIITLLLAMVFILILVRRITRPLKGLETFAERMKRHEFVPLSIRTNDELEDVAESFNSMGAQLVSYESSLLEKNRQMEQLLSDAAHDLKPPVSLIQLYLEGIRDGMDDGTFLETIEKQNSGLDQMINRLLFLSRIEQSPLRCESLDLSAKLLGLLEKYNVLARERDLEFISAVAPDIVITTQAEWMESLLSNLITNAVKYTSSPQIHITLKKDGDWAVFRISNECDNPDLEIDKIWNPCYVGEASRSKHLSGTGLGLSLVHKLSEKLNYDVSCDLKNGTITFTLKIPL